MTSDASSTLDRRLRIGLLAPPWATIPPAGYGGIETVVDQLARGFDRAGHDVRLFTIDGSACPVPRAGIVTLDDAPIIGTASVELHHMLAGYEWLSAQGCDVIHDHTLAGPLYGPATTSVPVVTTNHGPFTSRSWPASTAPSRPTRRSWPSPTTRRATPPSSSLTSRR